MTKQIESWLGELFAATMEKHNMFEYSEKAKDHFKHPRNVGILENPDAVGEAGSLACGQMLRLMMKLDSARRIVEAKFQAFGCASAIASCSALTEMMVGKTLDEAEKITGGDVSDYLDGLPDERGFCSDIGVEVVRLAIENYRQGQRASAKVSEKLAERVLDCRGLACPLNFVKTKILLDQMAAGETLCVLLNEEGVRNVPESAKAEGHEVLASYQSEDHWKIILRKSGTSHA
jgi:NifU-like protein involved in Fe-S cluster formation/TusA-related sulfurtransferase